MKAIYDARGNLRKAGRLLKPPCSRETIRHYRQRYKKVDNAINLAREERKDWGEELLEDKMEAGDTTAIVFFLKTQAKDRGYVERQESSGPDGQPLEVRVVDYRDGITPLAP